MLSSKQQNTSHARIYALVLLVVGIILANLVMIDAHLFNTQTTPHPTAAQISPIITSVVLGWKLLRSNDMHFTLRYPSNLSLKGPLPVEENNYRPGDIIVYNPHADPNMRDIGLGVSYSTKDMTKSPNSYFLIDVLLTSPVGNIATGNIEGYGDNVIIKLADLTINGHQAVRATFFRKGGTLQEPRYCEVYFILKDNHHYYELDTCATNATYDTAKAEVDIYSDLMEQIVNTFIIN